MKVFVILLALVAASSVTAHGHDRILVHMVPERGTYDVVDRERSRVILDDAQIGFVVAPYVELADVGERDVETSRQGVAYRSGDCVCRVEPDGALVCRKEGVGELEVWFKVNPQPSFVEAGFAFKNLSAQPVRLRAITVVDGGFLPELDRKDMQLLGGDSSSGNTVVNRTGKVKAENNALCFFANPKEPCSLVAGGLTYEDFRKYVDVADSHLRLLAHDPVGKRVDAGQTYVSPDRFYLDGVTANPFEALEQYAQVSEKARSIRLNYYTFPSVDMWFLSVTHFGGDAGATNSSAGAVGEMRHIADTGFLKYSPVAVRLVPDCYEQNNQQGWWDDKHWQMHGRKERCVVDHHYCEPYETTRKWAQAVRDLGGLPFTYFQPGIRSEDYAAAFPEHMLYNQARKYVLVNGKVVGDPHVLIGTQGMPDLLASKKWIPGYGKMYAEAYDYTDPGFLKHLDDVCRNLRDGGVQGVFYDYPDRAFPERGGLEDRYATATHAYRNVFRVARDVMGPDAYLQERLGPGSDATLGLVSSVRTAGDNNVLSAAEVTKVAMRWYKNRRLTNYDLDGKALLQIGAGTKKALSEIERRAALTMCYTVTGRLLLTESFRLFPQDVLHDLGRVFPFHATPLSARPIDAFTQPQPSVFDFPISDSWHQLVLYNCGRREKAFAVPLSGDTAFGKLGLDARGDYYVYDFWNDRFVGKLSGGDVLQQTLQPGEARMLSVRRAQRRPQILSTNRHIMQGYYEVSDVKWSGKQLSGKANVVAGEPFKLIVACNGFQPRSLPVADELTALTIERSKNETAEWSIRFQ
jgi:hypothetical protein